MRYDHWINLPTYGFYGPDGFAEGVVTLPPVAAELDQNIFLAPGASAQPVPAPAFEVPGVAYVDAGAVAPGLAPLAPPGFAAPDGTGGFGTYGELPLRADGGFYRPGGFDLGAGAPPPPEAGLDRNVFLRPNARPHTTPAPHRLPQMPGVAYAAPPPFAAPAFVSQGGGQGQGWGSAGVNVGAGGRAHGVVPFSAPFAGGAYDGQAGAGGHATGAIGFAPQNAGTAHGQNGAPGMAPSESASYQRWRRRHMRAPRHPNMSPVRLQPDLPPRAPLPGQDFSYAPMGPDLPPRAPRDPNMRLTRTPPGPSEDERNKALDWLVGRERSALQALFFAGWDDLEALLRTPIAKIAGDPRPLPDIFDNKRKQIVGEMDAFANNHPVNNFTAELGGAAPWIVVSGGTLGLPAGAARVMAVPGVMDATMGLFTGLLSGDSARDRLERGLFGAGIGGVAGVFGPHVARTAVEYGAPLVRHARSYFKRGQEAKVRVAEAWKKDQENLTRQQGPDAAAPPQEPPITQGRPHIQQLAKETHARSPKAAATFQTFADKQAKTRNTRAGVIFGKSGGPDAGNLSAQRANMELVAHRQQSKARTKAYRSGPEDIASHHLNILSHSEPVQAAMKRTLAEGAKRAAREGRRFNPSRRGVQFWEYTARHVDDAAEAATDAGNTLRAENLRGFSSTIRGQLDEHVPAYAAYRKAQQRFERQAKARETGVDIARGKTNVAQTQGALEQLHPDEWMIFKRGYVGKVLQDFNQAPDKTKAVTALFGDKEARARMELVLGRQKAKEFEAFLHVEAITEASTALIAHDHGTGTYAVGSHDHGAGGYSAASHDHGAGQLDTSNTGNHNHNYTDRGDTANNSPGTSGNAVNVADNTSSSYNTGNAGNHTHNVTGSTASSGALSVSGSSGSTTPTFTGDSDPAGSGASYSLMNPHVPGTWFIRL